MSKILTVPDLAQKIKLSTSTVYRYVSQRKIPFYKLDQAVLFREEDIDEWLESRRVEPISIFSSIKNI